MLMHEMDKYTRHLYQKLLPQVAKITYHDMPIIFAIPAIFVKDI